MIAQTSLPTSPISPQDPYLDFAQVKAFAESITGHRFYCQAHVWKLMKNGKFPQTIKLSARNLWRKSDILAWLRSRGVSSIAE